MQAIINEINNSNINNELKEILIDRIEDILVIIKKYKIYGTNKLIKSIEASIGSIYINQNNINTDEENNLCKKILLTLKNFIEYINQNVPLLELALNFFSKIK